MGDSPYRHLIGHCFPGGRTTVPRWMNQLWCDAVCADGDTYPHVHPALVYYAAVQGSGTTFQEIFDLLDGDNGSGIMVGEQRFRFAEPMEIDVEYDVRGAIIGVERKSGRRAGTFDIATFELIVSPIGELEPIATATTSFVFPRREVIAGVAA
jgi:hypothetical protein